MKELLIILFLFSACYLRAQSTFTVFLTNSTSVAMSGLVYGFVGSGQYWQLLTPFTITPGQSETFGPYPDTIFSGVNFKLTNVVTSVPIVYHSMAPVNLVGNSFVHHLLFWLAGVGTCAGLCWFIFKL